MKRVRQQLLFINLILDREQRINMVKLNLNKHIRVCMFCLNLIYSANIINKMCVEKI